MHIRIEADMTDGVCVKQQVWYLLIYPEGSTSIVTRFLSPDISD